jgi:nucleoside-diphosphate-sugar epimerase
MAICDWVSLHGDAFRGERALVTGGAGFIGSHLSEAMLELGASVVVLDVEQLAAKHGRRLSVVRGSILDQRLLDEVTEGCRWVFHQAAWGSVPRSVEIPLQYEAINSQGTAYVLDAARRAGVQRVMFAASSSAYGDSPELPKIESMPVSPRSPYAATKVAGEARVCGVLRTRHGGAAVLQHFRPAAERQLRLRCGYCRLRQGPARGRAAGHLRRRGAVA